MELEKPHAENDLVKLCGGRMSFIECTFEWKFIGDDEDFRIIQ